MDELVKKPKSRTALKSFNKLVSAAEKVIYEKGYFNSTVNDIVAEAELGTGTFYIYFDSKYAMYVYLLRKYASELKMTLTLNIKDCKTRLDKETIGIRTFIRHAIDNPRCYNLIWESLYVDRNLFFDYYRSFADGYVRGLARAQDEIDPALDLETVAYCLIGISNFVGLQAITSENISNDRVEQMVETIRCMLQNGVFKKLDSQTETAKDVAQ